MFLFDAFARQQIALVCVFTGRKEVVPFIKFRTYPEVLVCFRLVALKLGRGFGSRDAKASV